MTPTYYKYKRLRDIGMTNEEIAHACGVGTKSVAVTLSRYRSTVRAERTRECNRRAGELYRRARGVAPSDWRRADTAVLEIIRIMRRQDRTFAEIAATIRTSRSAVAGLVYRHGLNP